MIDRITYVNAANAVDWTMINTLGGWLNNEKNNLDGYIANPQSHVDYDPYIIPDFTKLQQRSTMLGDAAGYANTIVQFKQGSPNVTEAMYELAVDNMPIVLFQRLQDWMMYRYALMQRDFAVMTASPTVPIKDYEGLVTFDAASYQTQIDLFNTCITNLAIVIEYKAENNLQTF